MTLDNIRGFFLRFDVSMYILVFFYLFILSMSAFPNNWYR